MKVEQRTVVVIMLFCISASIAILGLLRILDGILLALGWPMK